jgi:glycosyltransferase involved in cell wall biosynthesis
MGLGVKKIIVVQRVVPHYRVAFFDLLSRELRKINCKLIVLYGKELSGTVPKTAKIEDFHWAVKIKNRYFKILGIEVVWQPVLNFVKGADLIIIEQASRLLVNYLLIALCVLNVKRVAYWGHGRNFQKNDDYIFFEKWKSLLSSKVDWWFPYTKKGEDIVAGLGFPKSKINVVWNSIDTLSLVKKRREVSEGVLNSIKARLGIASENIAIFCGGLYAEKKLGFLLEACGIVRRQVPDFSLIIIGDGPDLNIVQRHMERNDWIYYVGEVTGENRIPYFELCKLTVMPGLVGLVIIDSFIFDAPLVTVSHNLHSPEIEYLENGVNGFITPPSIEEYSSKIVELLNNPQKRIGLLKGCQESANKYSIEDMVKNFLLGIRSILGSS